MYPVFVPMQPGSVHVTTSGRRSCSFYIEGVDYSQDYAPKGNKHIVAMSVVMLASGEI